jgi:hypothetical protein
VKRLAEGSHFAHGQEAADSPKVGLNDGIRIVSDAFAISVQAAEAFSAGSQNIHFAGQSRRALEIVSRQTALPQMDAGRLHHPMEFGRKIRILNA